MSNTTISPNMLLPVPVVGTDPGPDWANNLNASLEIIDSHNHSTSQGVQINPSGININANLPFNSNNATTLRTSSYTPQAAPLNLPTDIDCIYVSGVDLYYNDGNGNQVRITQGGNVSGSTGTITGLPSGTASASYSTGTFTFQSATATPAVMAVGPIVLGRQTASSNTITIQPTTGIASNYSLNLPAVAPAANQILVSDGSGNLTWISGYTANNSFTVTFGNVSGTVTDTWYYSLTGNIVTITPGAGNTKSFTKSGTGTVGLTGFPAGILPSASTLYAAAYLSTNGDTTYPAAKLTLNSGGGLLFADTAENLIANGASCLLAGISFTYLLRA